MEWSNSIMEDLMPRKRTPDQASTETESQPTTEVSTAATPQPETETPEQSQSFAERIRQQRGWNVGSDPFGIAGDYVVGVRLFEKRRDRQMAIKFEDKPGQDVRDRMKDAGYRWNSRDMMWVKPFEADTAMTTRIEAERLYQEVRDMLRQEKGIEAGQEIPF